MEIRIDLPIIEETAENLHAGDYCLLNGKMFVARDAAHKRFIEELDVGEKLPFNIKDATIYYMGPSPERPGNVIGAAGPTTAGRMDKYTPRLLASGLRAMIGKGKRTAEVIDAINKYKAVYFAAIGGEGALLSKHIISQKILAFEDLGAEALREITVKDFPVIVINDCHGGNLYEDAPKKYRR